MARIATEIVWFDMRSLLTGKLAAVMQRTEFRLDRSGGAYVRIPLQTEFSDRSGKTFQKVSPGVVRCVADGEEFTVLRVSPKLGTT